MPDEDSREFLLRDNCRKDGMIESEEMFFFSFFLSFNQISDRYSPFAWRILLEVRQDLVYFYVHFIIIIIILETF